MTALETRHRPRRVRCVDPHRDAPWRGRRRAARGACLAVALAAALGPRPSAAQEWVGSPGNPAAPEAPPPAAVEAPAPPRPAPQARGLLGIGFGGAITSFGPALGLTFSAGGALSDRFRLDLVLSAVGYRGSFDPPATLAGADRAEESNLEVSRGAVQLALTRRIERLEVWAGAGWARATASAEVLGPQGCLLGLCGDELLAEGEGEGSGPIVSAGVRAALSQGLLLGVELHKPFIRRVELGIPLSVNLGSAYVLASFTWRFLSPRP